jgi:hypothetical protein
MGEISDVVPVVAGLVFVGVITPPTLVAQANDYSPAGGGQAARWRLSATPGETITGIAGGIEGRMLILKNIGGTGITLAAENVASAAANRFAIAGGVTLSASGGAAIVCYDGASARWRVISVR